MSGNKCVWIGVHGGEKDGGILKNVMENAGEIGDEGRGY